MDLVFLSINIVITAGSVRFFLSEKVVCDRFSTLCCLWEWLDFREVLPNLQSKSVGYLRGGHRLLEKKMSWPYILLNDDSVGLSVLGISW